MIENQLPIVNAISLRPPLAIGLMKYLFGKRVNQERAIIFALIIKNETIFKLILI